MRSRVLAVLAATAVTAAGLAMPAFAAPATGPVYLQPDRPVPQRVHDLLRRMTLDEKIGQLTQIVNLRMMGDCGWSGGDLTPACMKSVLVDHKVGSVLSGGGNPPGPQNDLGARNTPRDWAEMTNTIQRYAIENSRLHLPVIYGVDAVHGHNNVLNATLFPQQIGLGAAWDDDLVARTGAATARAVKATGISWDFAPVSDVARDTRWGRYYETFSEDPVLAGGLAASAVKGLQADGRVAATMKHFAGYSQPLTGHDRSPSQVDLRYLQDTLLPPYRAQVDAGVDTVMVNSGAVNGIPAHASHYLLTEVLRDRWHFPGVVVSDWQDVRALKDSYHLAADYPGAIAIAVNAGVDVAMEPYDAAGFTAGLLQAVRQRLVPQRRIDQAAGRVLALKFTLGLFEHPYVDSAAADPAVLGADRALARRAATESMTLLRNDNNLLPFAPGRKIVVTGPHADNLRSQLGGWSVGWQGVPLNVLGKVKDPTILAALTANAPPGTRIVPGGRDPAGALRDADAAVVVVGEGPGAEGLNDKEVPELDALQQSLVASLRATGKPVVVVVVAGRPLVLGPTADAPALLMAYQPGSEGGNAVADVLFGTANPSGRLPVSWPRSTGDVPMFYQQLPGTNSGISSLYEPLYPFGAGLSYTTYAVRDVAVERSVVRRDGTLRVRVTVANTGGRDGDLVVPVYVGQPVSRVLTPPKRLVGYARVNLAAGQEKVVRVAVPASRLALTPGDIDAAGPPRVEPGGYTVLAGDRTVPFAVR
jgi:beta-glucosidase